MTHQDLQQIDLLALIGQAVALRRVARTNGGEYQGPCPFCRAGHDRFHVWPQPLDCRPNWWCRSCERTGDAVTFVRLRDGIGVGAAYRTLGLRHEQSVAPLLPPEPPEPAEPPGVLWQGQASDLCAWAERRLWQPTGQRALAWLQQRGLSFATILEAGLGYNPQDWWSERAAWALPDERDGRGQLWFPRGILIPWVVDGAIAKLLVRRPGDTDGRGKYIAVSGSSNALYNTDALIAGRPAVLTEGVFDALAVQQAAGELAVGVAAGTTWARRLPWIVRLALCRPVLVAYDADAAGAAASAYWCDVLGSAARRWQPLVDDPAAMLAQGLDVGAWIEAGLAGA